MPSENHPKALGQLVSTAQPWTLPEKTGHCGLHPGKANHRCTNHMHTQTLMHVRAQYTEGDPSTTPTHPQADQRSGWDFSGFVLFWGSVSVAPLLQPVYPLS